MSDNKSETSEASDQNPRKEVKAAEEEEKEKPRVGFTELFRFADSTDTFLMIFGGTAAFVNGAAIPAFAYFMGKMVDEMVGNPDVSDLALMLVYVGLGSMVLCIFQVACWMISAARQMDHIQRAYFTAVMHQDAAWHDEHKPGELCAHLSADTQVIRNGINDKFSGGINMVGMTIFGFVFGFFFSWRLTLVTMATMPVVALVGGVLAGTLENASAASREGFASAGESATEAFENIRTVQSFSTEEFEAEKFEARLAPAKAAGVKKEFVNVLGIGASYGIIFASYGLAFWYASKLVIDKKNTAGEVIAVFFSVISSCMSIGMIFPPLNGTIEACGAAYEMFSVIDRVPAIIVPQEDVDSKQLPGVPPILRDSISFRDVTFAYPSREDQKIFEKFNLDIKAGSRIAFTGPSGCGKSTIISMILRLYDPQEGGVFVDGCDLKEMELRKWRSQIGTVSQEPVLFTGTIADNIRLGSENAPMEEIVAACRQANIHDFIDSLPEKYETTAGAVGSQLSGGQKQRIAIARAILRRPPILLLDEATSALDRKSEAEVQAALNSAMKQAFGESRTVITVAHRLTTIRGADCIYYIDGDGTKEKGASSIVEHGTFDELMAKQGRFAAMAARQLKTTGGSTAKHEKTMASGSAQSPTTAVEAVEEQEVELRNEIAADLSEVAKKEKEVWLEKNGDTLFSRVAALSGDKSWSIGLGFLGSVIAGSGYPVYCIVMGKFLTLFALHANNPDRIRDDTPLWALLFVAVGVAVFGGWTLQGFYAVAGEEVTGKVRMLLYKNILRQDQTFFDTPGREFGTLAGHLSGDAEAIHQLYGPSIGLKIQTACNIFGGLIVGLIWAWKVALVTFATMPILVVSGAVMAMSLAGLSGNEDEGELSENAIAAEAISNLRTIVAFGAEKQREKLYTEKLKERRGEFMRRSWIAGIAFGVSNFTMFGVLALSWWYGGKLIADGEEDFESIMIGPMAVMMGAMGAGETGAFAAKVGDAEGAAKRVLPLIDRTPAIDPSTAGTTAALSPPINVNLSGVGFAYPARPSVPVLRKFDSSFNSGLTYGLIGVTGCGKSSVIALLARFYDPQRGAVLLNGVDVREVDIKSWRACIGIVQQEPPLFSGTIKENIKYGRRNATDEEVEEVARTVQLHDDVVAMKRGYNTKVGYRGRQLSGGQKQRVAIARALLCRPHLLLLDEATSALDNATESTVLTNIAEYCGKFDHEVTVVSIAHRLTTIRNSNRIALVDAGSILEEGSHEELMSTGGEYKTLWNAYSQGTQ